jgi:hypothetical protein
MGAVFDWLRRREYLIKARTICRLRGHRWSEWEAGIVNVRQDVSLAEQELCAPEATRTCRTCWMVDSRVATDDESRRAIDAYITTVMSGTDPTVARWRFDLLVGVTGQQHTQAIADHIAGLAAQMQDLQIRQALEAIANDISDDSKMQQRYDAKYRDHIPEEPS